MKHLLIIVPVLLFLNSCSFVAARIFGKLGGKLKVIRATSPVKQGDRATMNYVVGNPEDISLATLLTQELRGGVTFIEHRTLGWKPEATADLISEDATRKNYQTKLLTISVGDQVARYLESDIWAIETTAIFPCSNPNCLKISARVWLSFSAMIFELICVAIGWLSCVISVRTKRGSTSLILFADLCFEEAYNFPPETFNQTTGLILCEKDRHTKAKYVEQLFGVARKVYLKKSQCATQAKTEQAVLEAYREIFKQRM